MNTIFIVPLPLLKQLGLYLIWESYAMATMPHAFWPCTVHIGWNGIQSSAQVGTTDSSIRCYVPRPSWSDHYMHDTYHDTTGGSPTMSTLT